ncbi:hypothetical protein HanIR_Chr15g0739851 [Helianthus annuus]|nr:hypothetical protein HanIR_Chr15g0739851 [Helianthus annuus]
MTKMPLISSPGRAVNEPNVQRTVREPFGGKFVYVRSISLTNEHEQKNLFG